MFDETQSPFTKIHNSTPSKYNFLHEGLYPLLLPYFSFNKDPPNEPNTHNDTQAKQTEPTINMSSLPASPRPNTSPLASPRPNTNTTHTPTRPSTSRPNRQSSILNSPLQARAQFGRPNSRHIPTKPTVTPSRTIQTRSMSDITKPKHHINLSVTTSPSPIPKTPKDALSNRNWKNAMIDEYNALIENKTWELVPRTPNMYIIRSM